MKKLLLVALASLIAGILCYAEILEVKVTGLSTMEAGDTTLARHKALADVMQKAVEKSVGDFMSETSMSENDALLQKNIYDKAGGYIKKLEIVEAKTSDASPGKYELMANASVDKDDIKKDLLKLGILTAGKPDNMPVILAFIQEKNIDDVHWHFQARAFNFAENTINEAFQTQGFNLVSLPELINGLTADQERAFYSDDLNTILKMGSTHGADVVISGKAISRVSRENRGFDNSAFLQASVNLDAIQVKNGRKIASSSGMAELINSDEIAGGAMAIKEAAQKATLRLITELKNSQTGNIIAGIKVTLVANGLKSIEDLIQFRKEFEAATGPFRAMERRTFSGGTAAYDLLSNKDALLIAIDLSSHGLKSFDYEVRAKAQNYLELNLKLK